MDLKSRQRHRGIPAALALAGIAVVVAIAAAACTTETHAEANERGAEEIAHYHLEHELVSAPSVPGFTLGTESSRASWINEGGLWDTTVASSISAEFTADTAAVSIEDAVDVLVDEFARRGYELRERSEGRAVMAIQDEGLEGGRRLTMTVLTEASYPYLRQGVDIQTLIRIHQLAPS